MKKIITLILIPFFLGSCNNEENSSALNPADVYAIDFNKIEGTSQVNPIAVKFTTIAGDEISDPSQLQPNSLYHLVVIGAGATFYRIKASDGFVVTQNPLIDKSSSGDFVFVVKTTEEIIGGLYANIVPIHMDGKKMFRENPQVFLLLD